MKIVIYDDNKEEGIKYQQLIMEFAKKYEVQAIITICKSWNSLIFTLESKNTVVDVLLIEISKQGTYGIELAKRFRKNGYRGEIIFCSICSDYALQAFDVQAFYYIIKNKIEINRAEEIFVATTKKVLEKEKEYFLFKCKEGLQNVVVSTIYYFEYLNGTIHVKCKDDDLVFHSTMYKIEIQFTPYEFIRIHRAFIVSLRHIQKMTYKTVTMVDGTKLPIGRKYANHFKTEIEKRIIVDGEFAGIKVMQGLM